MTLTQRPRWARGQQAGLWLGKVQSVSGPSHTAGLSLLSECSEVVLQSPPLYRRGD